MYEFLLVFFSILLFLFIFAGVAIDSLVTSDKFSALKLFSYFSLIEAFVMLWASLRPEFIERYVFGQLHESYHEYSYVLVAYIFSLVVYFFVAVGIFFASYVFRLPSVILGAALRLRAIDGRSLLVTGCLFYILGVLFYVVFVSKIGGLANLWENVGMRTTLAAGYSYYQSAYTFFIYLGGTFLYVFFVRKRYYFLLVLALFLGLFVLGSLGQRSPVAIFCFILLMAHNYFIKRFSSFFNARILFVGLALVVFMFSIVQFRPGQDKVDNINRFERDVILRLGIIERQVAVVGYFERHDYWSFGAYKSLLYAPIPRLMYPEKPPVDTGVYINAIRQGVTVKPPVPAADLDPTSWPDYYLSGYMAFGLMGLLVVSLISGFVFGAIYRLMLDLFGSVSAVVMYGWTAFMGAIPLSPYGIVQLLSILVPLCLLGWLLSFRMRLRV